MKSKSRTSRCGDFLAQELQKDLRCLGKELIFFPDDVDMRGHGRREGTKAQFALARRIDEPVDAQHAADASFRHQGGIVDEIISRNDVQFLRDGAVPFRHVAAQQRVAGLDERNAAQILGRNALLGRERAIFWHEQSPDLVIGQAQALVAGEIGGFDDQSEVQKPLVDVLADVGNIAAVDMQFDVWILRAHLLRGIQEELHRARLAAADIDVPAEARLRADELALRLFVQGEDLLRAAAQELSRFGQAHFFAAHEEGLPHFFLHFLDLPCEAWLGDVQKVRRLGDALFPRDGEEVFHLNEFHAPASLHDISSIEYH